MTRHYVLDTHVLIWWVEGSTELAARHRRILNAVSQDAPVFVSDISLWEVAVLCQRNRLSLTMPVIDWLEKAVAPPLVARVGISPAIAAGTLNLPANFHRDPADRLIVATTQALGATLLTCDRRIVATKVVPVA